MGNIGVPGIVVPGMGRVAPADLVTMQQFLASMATQQARLLASGLSVNALRTNALLREDEWKEIDQAVVDTARENLVGIADLRDFNLVRPLGGLGVLISQYERQGDMSAANVDMGGDTPGEEDLPDFDSVGVPIPIVHKDFRLNIRHLEASRRTGEGLDTTTTVVATRKVTEKLEEILFKGAGITVDGKALYGYTNHPDRNTGNAAGDFGTISNIYTTVLNMVQAAQNDNYFGPYVLYVSLTQYQEGLAVYTDGTGETAWARVLKNIPNLRAVRPVHSNYLAAGNLVLVTMQRDVVDLAVGQDIVPVEWSTMGGMVAHFKVFAAMAPRIKSDKASKSGIVHYTGA